MLGVITETLVLVLVGAARRLCPFALVTLRCMGLVEGVDSRPPGSLTSRSFHFLLAIASTRVENPRLVGKKGRREPPE